MVRPLGITRLDIDIKAKLIVYCAKLVNEDQSKISHMIYLLLYKLDVHNIFKSNWASILVQVTIYRRLLIGRDGHLYQSEAYDIS